MAFGSTQYARHNSLGRRRISDLLRANFQQPSRVYWAIADADRRMDDVFAEPRSSFERVKDLYLEALRLALEDLGAKTPEAGDSR